IRPRQRFLRYSELERWGSPLEPLAGVVGDRRRRTDGTVWRRTVLRRQVAAAAAASSSSGAGMTRSERTGENRTGRIGTAAPIAPTQIAVCSDATVAMMPPITDPIGNAPQTMNRIVAFIRP